MDISLVRLVASARRSGTLALPLSLLVGPVPGALLARTTMDLGQLTAPVNNTAQDTGRNAGT